MFKKIFKKLKCNKGVTIAESIVAFFVIAAVSITTVTTVSKALNKTTDTIDSTEARVICDNLLELFKYSQTMEEFDYMVDHFVNIRNGEEHIEGNKGTYSFLSGTFDVYVNVSFNGDNNECYLSVMCSKENSSGTFSVHFTKY